MYWRKCPVAPCCEPYASRTWQLQQENEDVQSSPKDSTPPLIMLKYRAKDSLPHALVKPSAFNRTPSPPRSPGFSASGRFDVPARNRWRSQTSRMTVFLLSNHDKPCALDCYCSPSPTCDVRSKPFEKKKQRARSIRNKKLYFWKSAVRKANETFQGAHRMRDSNATIIYGTSDTKTTKGSPVRNRARNCDSLWWIISQEGNILQTRASALCEMFKKPATFMLAGNA